MDADTYPQEVLADEEPKYLRRQKPLEIKRRKFGRKAWKTYLHVTAWTAGGLAGAALPWVEQATGRRALPHAIQVEIVERTPIAFLRDGADMALVDVHGVILDRPL